MWGSWAVYTSFALIGALIGGIVWGYQRDKRDEINLKKVFMNKEKIYVNLFLDPLPEDEMARNASDDDDYDALQEEKMKREELRRKRIEEKTGKYAGNKVDEKSPVKGLFSPEEMLDKFGIDLDGKVAQRKAEEAKLKKKKKKKAQTDYFFEGGENEYVSEYD